jgi:hypothetical protein
MDANGIVYMKSASETADHTLTIGKDIGYMRSNKRLENLANTVYVVGGGNPNLFNKYERASSINTYGKFERKIQDGRVTVDGTSDIMAKRVLDRNDNPETRTVIRVIDNNGENEYQGQNIESYQVGDTIQIKNLNYGSNGPSKWDISKFDINVWDYPIQYSTADVLVIVSIMYYPRFIEIEAASRLPEVPKRIEDIARNLDTQFQNNLPTSPTSRTI